MNYKQLTDPQRHQIESYLKADFNQTKIAEENILTENIKEVKYLIE